MIRFCSLHPRQEDPCELRTFAPDALCSLYDSHHPALLGAQQRLSLTSHPLPAPHSPSCTSLLIPLGQLVEHFARVLVCDYTRSLLRLSGHHRVVHLICMTS